MEEKRLTCAFTGHRQVEKEAERALCALLVRAVAYAYAEGCRTFLTGGALGFDTLAARTVIAFRLSHRDVRLELLLPCLNQSERWTARRRTEYDWVLSEADEVCYFSDAYDKSCMRRRNAALAERCDLLIAYVGHERSGSAQTMRIASRLGRRIYNLYASVNKDTVPCDIK